MSLHVRQKQLALLNIVGGMAVLASYVWAFAVSEELRTGLWGGVPEVMRPYYVRSMLLAAAGYFPFTWLLVFRTELSQERAYPWLLLCYALVLFPSAAWLPLTVQMLEQSDPLLWIGIRAVLALVGIGALGLLALLIGRVRREGGSLPWLALIGCVFFCWQTVVLDALIWPAYFPI